MDSLFTWENKIDPTDRNSLELGRKYVSALTVRSRNIYDPLRGINVFSFLNTLTLEPESLFTSIYIKCFFISSWESLCLVHWLQSPTWAGRGGFIIYVGKQMESPWWELFWTGKKICLSFDCEVAKYFEGDQRLLNIGLLTNHNLTSSGSICSYHFWGNDPYSNGTRISGHQSEWFHSHINYK